MADLSQETYNKLVKHHEKVIWTRFILVFFALWLFFVPISFNYLSHSKTVMINDMAMGVIVLLFALFSFSPKSKFFPYCLAIVGIWLNFAPLIFWAPMGIMYLNDTLVGSLIIAFSILIPGVPGESLHDGPETPPGWSYNPSSWPQRLPTMCLAVVSWFFARYMSAFQLGYIDVMWDPFFGAEGTIKVITSKLSQSFPVSDAGMGAMAYCLEFLLGSKRRSSPLVYHALACCLLWYFSCTTWCCKYYLSLLSANSCRSLVYMVFGGCCLLYVYDHFCN